MSILFLVNDGSFQLQIEKFREFVVDNKIKSINLINSNSELDLDRFKIDSKVFLLICHNVSGSEAFMCAKNFLQYFNDNITLIDEEFKIFQNKPWGCNAGLNRKPSIIENHNLVTSDLDVEMLDHRMERLKE